MYSSRCATVRSCLSHVSNWLSHGTKALRTILVFLPHSQACSHEMWSSSQDRLGIWRGRLLQAYPYRREGMGSHRFAFKYDELARAIDLMNKEEPYLLRLKGGAVTGPALTPTKTEETNRAKHEDETISTDFSPFLGLENLHPPPAKVPGRTSSNTRPVGPIPHHGCP